MENPNSLEKSIVEASSLTCDICIEPMTHNKRFKNKKRCAHPFCIDCIVKYIEAKIEEKEANVPCPSFNCERLLDPLSCRRILPAELFEKWCDVLCESSVLSHESAYCPFPDCSTLILNECQEIVTRSECPNCKKLLCFQCEVPWHAGFRCDETGDMMDENDILFGELVERNMWRRCPGCKYHVERNEGCQNIKCRCGVLFCYGCGKVKNACECHRRNVVVEDNMGNRGLRTNDPNLRVYDATAIIKAIIAFIIYLMCIAFIIFSIIELKKAKGKVVAGVVGTIIIFVLFSILDMCLKWWGVSDD